MWPARCSTQGEDVAGADDVPGLGVGRYRRQYGTSAVRGADARGDALPGLDGDGEGRGAGRLIVVHHHGQGELLDAVVGQAEADQAAPVLRHEIHGVSGGLVRRHDEVALVLAVLVVHEDDHPASTDFLDGLGYSIDGVWHLVTSALM